MPMLKEFKEFLLKQNVVALAIAVVVATALSTLVKAVVDDRHDLHRQHRQQESQ